MIGILPPPEVAVPEKLVVEPKLSLPLSTKFNSPGTKWTLWMYQICGSNNVPPLVSCERSVSTDTPVPVIPTEFAAVPAVAGVIENVKSALLTLKV